MTRMKAICGGGLGRRRAWFGLNWRGNTRCNGRDEMEI
jgi:hypothetical protein